ncbi:MAG: hypothetical protein U5L45_22395 [Saprospiraceae bacterium]|nr:hypothetical protein [Saprospiraceae bacterium]
MEPERLSDQWDALIKAIKERKRRAKSASMSRPIMPMPNGLSHHEYSDLMKKCQKATKKRHFSRKISSGMARNRTPKEMTLYEHIAHISHQIVREGLSEKVISTRSHDDQ